MVAVITTVLFDRLFVCDLLFLLLKIKIVIASRGNSNNSGPCRTNHHYRTFVVRLRFKQNILKDSRAVQIFYFGFEISDWELFLDYKFSGRLFWMERFWQQLELGLNAKKNGLFPVIF